jgi:hypothetical protein
MRLAAEAKRADALTVENARLAQLCREYAGEYASEYAASLAAHRATPPAEWFLPARSENTASAAAGYASSSR